MTTPDELERQTTLTTAVARYEQLRTRDALAGVEDDDPRALSRTETLELLALAVVIARKAGYGRQLDVRAARAAGASWAQIGAALAQSRQAAWEAHARWIEGLARDHERTGTEGLDDEQAAAARQLAGRPDADA